MATPSPFAVIGMDRTILEGGDRVLDKPRFVQRIGVDRDLNIKLLGNRQRIVDYGRGRAPVFMQLEPHGAGSHLFLQRFFPGGVPLGEESEVERQVLDAF